VELHDHYDNKGIKVAITFKAIYYSPTEDITVSVRTMSTLQVVD